LRSCYLTMALVNSPLGKLLRGRPRSFPGLLRCHGHSRPALFKLESKKIAAGARSSILIMQSGTDLPSFLIRAMKELRCAPSQSSAPAKGVLAHTLLTFKQGPALWDNMKHGSDRNHLTLSQLSNIYTGVWIDFCIDKGRREAVITPCWIPSHQQCFWVLWPS
jgi:hypothetical protein